MIRRVKLGLAIGLASLSVLLSGLGLIALNAGGEARLGPTRLLPVAAGYDRAALRLLSARSPSPAAQAEINRLSHAAIRQYPYDQGAWLRLAYLDAYRHGALTKDGLDDLSRSYTLVGVDPYYGVDRVRLALEHCPQLSHDLLASVKVEVTGLWSDDRTRGQLKEMQPMIANPAGRLALALWILQLSQPKSS